MPLRDHFRPPIIDYRSWEGFHAMWPAVIVLRLVPLLPAGFAAEPRVRLGAFYEVDVGTYEDEAPGMASLADSGRGTATLSATALAPTWTVEADLSEPYEYEVLVYDERHGGRNLVAAIELVSPGNKDRSEARSAFASKAAALLRRGVCVSIVDLVTTRQFNLYTEMLALCGQTDPTFRAEPPPAYATSSRKRADGRRKLLESWAYPLAVGRPLSSIPLWLDAERALLVDLETSYEETCRVLRIA